MMKTTVQVEGLRVVRGGREVLHDLGFTLPAGQVIGLLGPSGCGKSTLMRVVTGVQAGVTGSVTVLGEPAGSAAVRSRIGYVTQAPSVYDDLTVRENLAFFARVLLPGSGAARRQRVEECVAAVRLGDHADQVVGALSGGQRSRASLAVALLGEPDLLVLDEPTVGLDPVLRVELWAMFHGLASDGATVLVSSHVMDEAERCDRLLLMRDGVFLADDTPAAIVERAGVDTVEQAFLRIVRGEEAA